MFNNGSLILGQESDGVHYEDFFDLMQSFSGELSQVEMWDIVLSENDIQNIAFCNSESALESNRVLTWLSPKWVLQNVTLEEIPLRFFCEADLEADKLIWLDVTNKIDFMDMCDQLGGTIPILSGKLPNEAVSVHKEYFKLFNNFYDIAEETCFLDESNIAIWMGNERKPFGSWYNPYMPNQTMIFNDIADGPFGCLTVVAERVEEMQCDSVFPCGVCNIPEDKIFYLKGLCPDDIEKLYDVKYYIHGIKNTKPYFR